MNQDISVVLPAYNRIQMLIPVVESILSQTVPVAEIIVIDDGSTDETAQRVPLCIAERPAWREKVRYIRQENQGQAAAINRGIAEAKSGWLAFSSHDDLWLPWKLEWQLRSLEERSFKFGLCFTDAWFMNNPHMKRTLFQEYGANLPGPTGVVDNPVRMIASSRHPVWVQTVLARIELVRRAGCFDPLMRYSEDHDFLFRIGLLTPFCYVSMPMVLIDRSPADIRHSGEAQNWHKVEFCLAMDQRRFETQLRLSDNLPADVQKRIHYNFAANQSHWANYYLDQREFSKARLSMRAAAAHNRSPRILVKQLLVEAFPWLSRAIFNMRERRNAPRYDRISWRSTTAAGKSSA